MKEEVPALMAKASDSENGHVEFCRRTKDAMLHCLLSSSCLVCDHQSDLQLWPNSSPRQTAHTYADSSVNLTITLMQKKNW